MVGFIFGKGQAYSTPEELKKARSVANALAMQQSAPKDVGSGLSAIGQALLYRSLMGKADASEKAGKEGAAAAFNPVLAALGGPTGFPAAPGSSKVASALAGKKPDDPNLPSRLDFARSDADASDLPSSFLASMDKVEGGGDYDTLFGHAQRDGGAFAGTHVSGMTINDALAFAEPSGPYGQSVKGKIGRVATPMGRYQIVGTTLRNAVAEMGLDPSTPFNQQTQDAIAAHLARKRIAGSDTIGGKIAALRSEWEGFKNVPDAQLQQIVADLETGGTGTALAANNSMATGQPIAPAPVQVASLDPSIGMNAAMSPVPAEYAAMGLTPEAWQRMNTPDGAVPQPPVPQAGVTPGAPGAETQAGQRVLSTMMNPQPMAGSPMPIQAMPSAQPTPQPAPQPAPQPQTVAQAPQQPGPDLSQLSPLAGGTAGAFDAAQGPSLQMLYNALQQPWLSDEQRAIVTGEIQRKQQEADPLRQLQLEKARRDLAIPPKQWQKLDDDTLFDPASGETKQIGGGPASGQFRFDGKSVEAQALNGLMDSGQLTTDQAQQLGAGKTITDPATGAIIFLTPQGVFGQSPQGGPPQPIPAPQTQPQGGPQGAPTPQPAPINGQGPAPVAVPDQRNGMITLTDPKSQKPTEAQRNRLSTVDQSFDAINSELDRYSDLVAKTGIEAFPGEAKDNLNTVRQGIMLQMKELFNLGVLNGPDLSLMERMIYDPVVDPFKEGGVVNMPSQAWSALTGDAGGRATNSVAELKRMLGNIKQSVRTNIPHQGETPTQATPTAEPSVDDLLKKYGG